MSFPFYHHEVRVESRDLDLFAPLFAETIKAVFPCEAVYFVGPAVSGDGLPTRWKAGVEVVRNSLHPVKDKSRKPALYLPLWAGNELFGVAVLLGTETPVLELSAADLLEKSRAVSRELYLVKLSAIDPLTGLGNGLVLQARLAAASKSEQETDNALVLFDLCPRAGTAGAAGNAVVRMGACLQSLIGHLAFPCHLGNGLFGLCWEGASEEIAAKMAEQVLQWLKRDNLGRGQAGIAACGNGDMPDYLDHAWQALLVAGKRGPFGLCAYASLVDRTSHPLYPPSGKVVRRLRHLMKDEDQFGLVELQSDDPSVSFTEELFADLPGVPVAADRGNGYIFLAKMTEKEVLVWCRSVQSFLTENHLSFSMGVCVYPFGKFRKGEMIGNCRKGLLHTAFFGPGSCTVFDGVSLNISGDVYYNEGDMVKAAREYQSGLQIDPENVNLLNSMGVTMAQMARYTRAIPYFEKVLAVDPRDFMALCNLGFAHVAMGNLDQAITFFEEGLSCDETHFDLLFQLGKIYSSQGRFSDTIKVLERAEKMGPENIEDVSHGAVHRFLGEAYFYEKKMKKGMASLQRAIRYNPRDALSLSLLGELYAESGEGFDIGLTFCRQAVEIDADCWQYWLRLGRLFLKNGRLADARQVLQQLLPLQRQHEDVLVFQAHLYAAQGKEKKACAVCQKILKKNSKHKEAGKILNRLQKKMDKNKI
jgi:tetratricopeptide (TPR) repeat protein